VPKGKGPVEKVTGDGQVPGIEAAQTLSQEMQFVPQTCNDESQRGGVGRVLLSKEVAPIVPTETTESIRLRII